MKMVGRALWVLLFLTLCGTIASFADTVEIPINILNASFEDVTLANGGWTKTIPHWDIHSTGGTYDPTAGVLNESAVDGENVAWVGPYSYISQTLTQGLTPYTDYTIQVNVGQRTDFAPITYAVQFFAGDVMLAQENSLHPAPGTFSTSVVTYSTGASHSLLGAPLSIRLVNTGLQQVVFDNVRIQAIDPAPVPEPASLLLLASGLSAAGAMVRRRTRQT